MSNDSNKCVGLARNQFYSLGNCILGLCKNVNIQFISHLGVNNIRNLRRPMVSRGGQVGGGVDIFNDPSI